MFLYHRSPPISIKKVRRKWKYSVKEDPFKILRDGSLIIISAALVFVLFYVPKMLYQPNFNLISSLLSSSGASAAGFALISPQLSVSLDWASQVLTPLGWILLIYGLLMAYKRDFSIFLPLTGWMILYFIFYGNLMGASPYFFFQAFIPAAMLIGYGLDSLTKLWGRLAGALIIVLAVWMVLNIHDVLMYRGGFCGPCSFSERMKEVTTSESMVIGMDETRHYEYYAGVKNAVGHPNPMDVLGMEKHFNAIRGNMSVGNSVFISTAGLSYDFLPDGAIAFDGVRDYLVNRISGTYFSNIAYDGGSKTLWDRDTGMSIPGVGLYGLTLFNEFRLSPVFTQESEDWHHKDLQLGSYNTTLYRIEERS
jgi:hypothetical protein